MLLFLAGPSPQHPQHEQINRDADRQRDHNKPFHFFISALIDLPPSSATRTTIEKVKASGSSTDMH
jgi:hypothetical protein